MSESSALDRVWTVPNIISLARLVLALVLFALIEGVAGRQDLSALVCLCLPQPLIGLMGGMHGNTVRSAGWDVSLTHSLIR
jgi:hypothetical protein